MNKVAFMTGITGQDGSYLARFLLEKGYKVHGLIRRSSTPPTSRIDILFKDRPDLRKNLILHEGDLTDLGSLLRIIQTCKPDEVYNLAAQSDVAVSFQEPEYTANVDALGVLRLLDAIRFCGLAATTRFYQASTSELYGLAKQNPQDERTPFHPRSPYAVAKLYGHWITINYRESYNMYACNGILFNHESPLRGESFVTRKITRALSRIKYGLQDCLYLGNLNAMRDWGHARDYVEMQWLMLQQEKPEDFVIATGQQYSVRYFVETAASYLDFKIIWSGSGLEEKGVDAKTGRCIIAVYPEFFRPAEVEALLGDSSYAREKLGWKPKTSFEQLVREMVENDRQLAQLEAEVKEKLKAA